MTQPRKFATAYPTNEDALAMGLLIIWWAANVFGWGLCQKLLLADLPDAPSDGRYCKGGQYRTATRLRDHGLARCVGSGGWVGGYFVRTNAGRAAILETIDMRVCAVCGEKAFNHVHFDTPCCGPKQHDFVEKAEGSEGR